MQECPASSGRAAGTQETCHPTSAKRKGHNCLSLGDIFIGSEITGLRRAGTGTELRRAARGFAPGQTCCVGSAGRLPGPPSQQWLGTWHLAPCVTSVGLALWPPCRRAPPFPVAGVVSLSQCGGVGVRGGHLPGCRQAPSASTSWALGGYGRVRPALAPLLPACGSLAVLEGPSRPQRDIIRTNSGRVQERVRRKQQSGSSSRCCFQISLRSVSLLHRH